MFELSEVRNDWTRRAVHMESSENEWSWLSSDAEGASEPLKMARNWVTISKHLVRYLSMPSSICSLWADAPPLSADEDVAATAAAALPIFAIPDSSQASRASRKSTCSLISMAAWTPSRSSPDLFVELFRRSSSTPLRRRRAVTTSRHCGMVTSPRSRLISMRLKSASRRRISLTTPATTSPLFPLSSSSADCFSSDRSIR
mmetsp:Transcript_17017/g.39582  ORF Transcript_17017/g.39582 Transcript_17017/m.39582 type:complete len:201 (-) Transcript_17017:582-1184(-)